MITMMKKKSPKDAPKIGECLDANDLLTFARLQTATAELNQANAQLAGITEARGNLNAKEQIVRANGDVAMKRIGELVKQLEARGLRPGDQVTDDGTVTRAPAHAAAAPVTPA